MFVEYPRRQAPSWGRTKSNEDKQGDELGTYVVLSRTALTEHGMTYSPRGLGLRSLDSSRGSHAPKGEDGKVVHRAKPGRCCAILREREVREMRSAEQVLGIIQERGKRGLPLEDLYRQLYNPHLYLKAYGKIYQI
jgi:hypothetical protein